MTTATEAAPKIGETMVCECSRCIGKGHFPNWRHIVGGVCFRCCGEGKETYRYNGRRWLRIETKTMRRNVKAVMIGVVS